MWYTDTSSQQSPMSPWKWCWKRTQSNQKTAKIFNICLDLRTFTILVVQITIETGERDFIFKAFCLITEVAPLLTKLNWISCACELAAHISFNTAAVADFPMLKIPFSLLWPTCFCCQAQSIWFPVYDGEWPWIQVLRLNSTSKPFVLGLNIWRLISFAQELVKQHQLQWSWPLCRIILSHKVETTIPLFKFWDWLTGEFGGKVLKKELKLKKPGKPTHCPSKCRRNCQIKTVQKTKRSKET